MKEGMVQSELAAVIQPRVLFKPGSWLAKIDFINHLILFNNVLITILSEKEGGKTSFGTLLQNNLDQQIKSYSISAKQACNKENIIGEIASQLHINANLDLATLVAKINEQKSHILLIIDDAHNLPESFIKESLSAIKDQKDFGFFHLCLISDYSIVTPLNKLAASYFDNLIHTIELGSLNENEARTYILQRAMTAHLITKPLTDLQFKQFYQLTKGNVAKINSNLEAYVFKCTAHKKKDPLKWIKMGVAAVGLCLLTGSIGFYLSQSYDLSSTFQIEPVKIPVHNEQIAPAIAKQCEQTKILDSYIASWEDSSTRQLVYSALPTKQGLEDLNDELPSDTVAIIDKVVVIPKIHPDKLVTVKPKKLPAKLQKESKLVAISGLSKKNLSHSAKANAVTNLYTIQVAASHNKQDIERFKLKNRILANKAKVGHFTNAKGIWYVLTLGEYESRNKAQKNMSKLPSSIARLNPWVRPISSLG